MYNRLSLFVLLFSFLFLSSNGHAENVTVEIKTSLGNVIIELHSDKAPKTVANFLQYVDDGFYKNTVFHRVIPNFMVQGGGFDTDLNQKPTRSPIPIESDTGLKNDIGTIAMARTSDPNSATAQFFIKVAKDDFLNFNAPNASGYGYAVFGKVIKGMEVVNKITSTPTGSSGPFSRDVPKTNIIIQDITRISSSEKTHQ
mgnify:FL=1